MDELEKELKLTFIEEAKQLLSDTEQCFLDLENKPEEASLLDKIFRLAHNLKGSSRAVGLDDLGAFTHEFESLLLKLKKGELDIHPAIVSLLLKCNDHLGVWVNALQKNLSFQMDSSRLIADLQNRTQLEGEAPTLPFTPKESVDAPPSSLPSSEDTRFESEASEIVPLPSEEKRGAEASESLENSDFTVFSEMLAQETEKRLEVVPLPSLPLNSSPSTETVTPPLLPPLKVAPLPPSPTHTAEESIRISLSRLEKLINYVGELVIFQAVLNQQTLHHSSAFLAVRKTLQQMGKVTKEVQEISMNLRMVPLKQTFQKMQRIVRDTSALLEKKVNLSLEGEETEVDKTVLEALSDPLVHLVRNAVDHGIEGREKRRSLGKTEQGNILLKAYHKSGKLVIEIQDDGGGIDSEKLKQKGIEKGLVKPQQNLSQKEAIDLIFQAGFSTKSEVTEVSGRGVGMDVVKTNIRQLQGDIEVSTVLEKGSTFKITLPLTLAIIDGMVVRCGEERFVIPLAHVQESLTPKAENIQTTMHLGEILLLRGENIPLIRLAKLLGRKSEKEKIAIIIHSQQTSFAVLVDDILGQYQIVIKKLGPEIQHLKGYSGTAILGDGKPALILELPDLVQTAVPSPKKSPPQLKQVTL